MSDDGYQVDPLGILTSQNLALPTKYTVNPQGQLTTSWSVREKILIEAISRAQDKS